MDIEAVQAIPGITTPDYPTDLHPVHDADLHKPLGILYSRAVKMQKNAKQRTGRNPPAGALCLSGMGSPCG
jgi:hypothetical protein